LIKMDPLTYSCTHNEKPAKLDDGDHNVLQYKAKDVQTMMKNLKVFHLGDEMNRNKICYFINKYVTRVYGSCHMQ
jgi:hypothetical protein